MTAKRLRRSDSFLGVHFDFHANEDSTKVGEGVDAAMIEAIIAKVKPDYLQCDCKGHRGFSSYPTKVGNPAPGFVGDPLRVWRDATAKHGVALYMHYSGVLDVEAVAQHPDWARVDEKGEPDKKAASVFGPYVDELLIPQLKELADVYGVDGVWVDGDCWGTVREYREDVLERFHRETGVKNVPRSPEDPGYFEFSQFCRQGFRDYLKRYVDILHRHAPDFQVASNWAYSSQMPEPIGVDVDFISGDYSPLDSLSTARWEGRCIACQDKPWDLMSWGFAHEYDSKITNYKTVTQLCQESAAVLALGGGFQVYFTQRNVNGAVRLWNMDVMAEVAKFCRARQAVCHHAQAVPQVVMLRSTHDFQRRNSTLYYSSPHMREPLQGILNALLETQNSVEIRMEHNLLPRLKEYPLVILPETEFLEPEFKEALVDYVRNGGKLLAIGPTTAALFQKELDIEFAAEASEQTQWLDCDGRLAGLKAVSRPVVPGPKAKVFGQFYLCPGCIYPGADFEGDTTPAATIATLGKGKIAAVHAKLGERLLKSGDIHIKRWLNSLVRELFPTPLAELTGSSFVDVSVNRIGGKLAVNLLNTLGQRGYVYDEVPPVGPLELKLRLDSKPKQITLEPEGKPLPFVYQDAVASLTLDKLAIHAVVLVE